MRRADEIGSRLRYADRPRHSLDEDWPQRFGTQRKEDLEEIPVDVPEGIEMADTKDSDSFSFGFFVERREGLRDGGNTPCVLTGSP